MLSVADDGRGFTFDQAIDGLGIAGMRERALLVGGEFQIESRPGDRHKGSALGADRLNEDATRADEELT